MVLPQAAQPSASPGPGQVPSGTPITLTTSTPGAIIYYTTDGSTPTLNSRIYSQSTKPTISAVLTIRAMADKDGMAQSDVAVWSYSLQNSQQPEVPRVPQVPQIPEVPEQ